MIFINKTKGLEIIVPNSLLKELSELGVKAYPKEYGGFLVGFYSNDSKTLNIESNILPKKYKGERYSFERSAKGITDRLKELYSLKPKQYYVGEWHTHPDGSTCYSNTDLKSMIDISECDTVNIVNPVLLIISVGPTKVNDYDFYLYDDKNLLKYE